MDIPRVLTIAGSDSSGGAGIQADLKSFTAFRVYGMSVVTAVTAQNTLGVQMAEELPLELIEAQLRSVVSDIGVDAVKTGMLSSVLVVETVAGLVRDLALPNLVVDPVMVAKGGHPLLAEAARASVRDWLLPLATVATPNVPEAEALTGLRIESLDDMKRAAMELHKAGPRWVVVKGGHLTDEGRAVDVVFDGAELSELDEPRVPTKNTHGTGCTFSAAIAAGLARGLDPGEAIRRAKAYVTRAIEESLALGSGHGPTNHLVGLESIW
jgi:hydroxymethylpyrimidine/phosphomethylpyrimidine kinase